MIPRCLCLICLKPNPIWLEFLTTFTTYDVCVLIDDNTEDYDTLKESYPKITFLQVPNQVCKDNGYKNLNYVIKKEISGWDKAIYWFSRVQTSYTQTWFIEDDVFFHSEQTLVDIDTNYPDADLLTSTPQTNATGETKTSNCSPSSAMTRRESKSLQRLSLRRMI